MSGLLIETKLVVPRLRRELVARPRLLRRLSAEGRLTLVSAPAGFGKTTLLGAWSSGRKVAWLSLEESDNDPATFWTYVVAALRRVVPGLGGAPPVEATLVNELAATADDVVLVLDDYHVIDDAEVHDGVRSLVEHLPSHVHLVISTRADPPLPLARLRARAELVELRAADLRFRPDEAAAYLNDLAGLDLAAADIEALESRTEGWIAALQLAALSLRDRADPAGFIANFAGDDRYVVDYLVEEVLARQPDDVRKFLVETSVLDRLSGPLCAAVTGGGSLLETLDRANLFLVRLDDNRRWYRYHHLFADVLSTRLLDERPGEVAELHRRASRWYAENGENSSAVRHALAGGEPERAAALIELAVPALRRDRQEALLRGWLGALPDDVVGDRPVLATALAGALLAGGRIDGVAERLDAAERRLEEPAGLVVADRAGLAALPATIALYRSGLALAVGEVATALREAELAVERAGDDHLTLAAASGLRGLVFWAAGDLASAHAAYLVCVDGLRRAGHQADVLGCSISLADIETAQGRLRTAARTYERGLALAGTVRGTADMHVGLAGIAIERNDLDSARAHLERAQELGEANGLPQNPYRRRVVTAQLRAAEGDLPAALDLLDQAERVYTGDFSPNVRPIRALRAQLTGDRRLLGVSAEGDLSYLHEFEYVTLARLLVRRPDAGPLLDRLLAAAEAGGRTGTVIEILVLQALHRGDPAPLERALDLAEPEGYVRVFFPAMTLLRPLARKRAYVRAIVGVAEPAQDLAEPLSERELDVLRLLATDLAGPEIARRLVVSLNTLRTHTKRIYTKLGVNNRRTAVRRAADLGLL